jgi:hypothetical protein
MSSMPTLADSGLLMELTASRPQLLTVAQAAALLNASDRTIRGWIGAEKVPI